MKRTLGGLLLFLAVSWFGGPRARAIGHSDGCHISLIWTWEDWACDSSGCRCVWVGARDMCVTCSDGICELTPCDELGLSSTIGKVDVELSSFAACHPSGDPCTSGEQCGVDDGAGVCVTLQ